MILPLLVLNTVLALVFIAFGGRKIVLPKAKLEAAGMEWVSLTPRWVVVALGAAEILGALGLVLPLATGISPLLSPIAAGCLFVVMVGAVVVHMLRRERPTFPIVIGVLAFISASLGLLILS